MPRAEKLVQRLYTIGSSLPGDLAAQIAAARRDVTPLLLQLLVDRPIPENEGLVRADDCVECGQAHDPAWARFHAVDLLTDLREPSAIDAMLKILASSSSDEPIHDKIVERLPDFGGAALEPALAALDHTEKGAEAVESLCCILAALGVRDERILRALLDLLKALPRAGATYLCDYGDPAACPALLAVIADSVPDVDDVPARFEFLDIVDAYASLGGQLPADLKARIDGWLGSSAD